MGNDMSVQDDNIALVKKGYAAFTAGDIDSVMSLYDEDIEWVQPGSSAVSGTYHGKGELAGFLARLGEKSPTINPRHFFADGDMVVVLSEIAVGDESSDDAEVYTIRDGKTIRAQVYPDTAMMERVYGHQRVTSG
jgi:ketosteroid isomerase-like protein